MEMAILTVYPSSIMIYIWNHHHIWSLKVNQLINRHQIEFVQELL